MDKNWLAFWNDRYREKEFAYGTQPNEYFKQCLEQTSGSGAILMGSEGEGRNAVYAAKQGWDVSAYDISEEGYKKAQRLAEEYQVRLDYRVGELPDLDFLPEAFDAAALIYAHIPPHLRMDYHRLIDSYLKPGGYLLFEAYSKSHLAYRGKNGQVGGPGKLEMLFSVAEIQSYFPNYKYLELEERVVELSEGNRHQGLGSVIRFFGQKK
ncbi:MAG: class I SAM-dependent methyltransferase [Bacteroidota bacterium]